MQVKQKTKIWPPGPLMPNPHTGLSYWVIPIPTTFLENPQGGGNEMEQPVLTPRHLLLTLSCLFLEISGLSTVLVHGEKTKTTV